MKYKAVVFDMDGVIFDSEYLAFLGWQEIAEEYNIPDMDFVFKKCIGINAAATKAVFYEHYGPDFPYDEYQQEVSRRYHEKYDNGKLPTKPGIRELLEYLKQEGYKIGLASSSRHAVVYAQIRDAGLLPYFQTLTCGDMVEKSKPEPDIFLKACEELGIDPSKAIGIEDSYNGIRALSKANMTPVMVPDMLAPDEEMESLAYRIFKNLFEVRDWLRSES